MEILTAVLCENLDRSRADIYLGKHPTVDTDNLTADVAGSLTG